MILAALLVACGHHGSYVQVDRVALGRVVIYRNGVAYYERRATVSGGELTVTVPRERVDDFLKSLTVVDAVSRQPLPVAIPRRQGDGASLVMKLRLPTARTADVLLTYVTEAPAWKPSYRVVVGDAGKVLLEGWAVVDNTSGEDWKRVVVGVGSSSALSFRYDLWSVRRIEREQLHDQERFAVAPPTGVSPHAEEHEFLVEELDAGEVERVAKKHHNELSKDVAVRHRRLLENSYWRDEVGAYRQEGAKQRAERAAKLELEESKKQLALGDDKLAAASARVAESNQTIVIEASADANRANAAKRANDRAALVRDKLIDNGVAPDRIKITTKVSPGEPERVRLVAQPAGTDEPAAAARPVADDVGASPVGEAHFASERPMTIERGTSAMVSMVRGETDGEVVYLYDPETARGNAHFAFRAVRFRNPTSSTLETGPVTVYGNQRFIGEGLTEAIPPHASAVVPYALDRQILVERNDGDEDRIAKLATLQRGVLTAEVQHVRRTRLAITNRLDTPATVFIRHTVPRGWALLAAPADAERVGDAHLFHVALAPHAVTTVEIAEATPQQRTLELGADDTLAMMKVYVEAPEASPQLREQLRTLLVAHAALVDLATAQTSLRQRLADYKERLDELHAQLVTLQAVKTGGDLLAHLKAKMKDISNRVQETTIGIVDQEEKIMLARVRFQDLLAELSLPAAAALANDRK